MGSGGVTSTVGGGGGELHPTSSDNATVTKAFITAIVLFDRMPTTILRASSTGLECTLAS